MSLFSFASILCAKYDLETSIEKNILIIKKWNFDYEKALSLQTECTEFILENDQYVILIFCSHPKVLTIGRGLQKLKDETISLVNFDQAHMENVQIPLVEIKRGGGLTFHHEGQLVFYPILKTTTNHFKVYDLMISILEALKIILETEFHLNNLNVRKDLLGLWINNQKLASIGIAANRFVTYHGLALNCFNDQEFNNEISRLYPCGLPATVYTSIDQHIEFNLVKFNALVSIFKNEIYEMIERQRSSLPINDLTSAIVSDKNFAEINLNTESSLS